MKKLKIIIFVLLLLTGMGSANKVQAQRGHYSYMDFNTFYNALSPYGRWTEHEQYGRVWVYNEPGFRPYYSRGHWDYTDYGWTWASDYDWGWAPFHYGRWENDPYMGWIWIPGYDWAPAWVGWSQAGDYYGWAPLGFGLDLSASFGRIPYDRWCYLPRAYITQSSFYDYCVPFSRNRYFYGNSVVINNIYDRGDGRYFRGPYREEVERYSHERIESRRIDDDERYGFGHRGYGNGGNYHREEGQNGQRENDNDQRNSSDERTQWQQNRNASRQRVFGDRTTPRSDGPGQGNSGQSWPRNNNGPESRGIRQQPQVNAPIEQPRQNKGLENQQSVQPRHYGGNAAGDQRVIDRVDSRQRVFGNQRDEERPGNNRGFERGQNNSNNRGVEKSGDNRGGKKD
ncbi:MAG: hypothetical protein NVS9B7_24380 [Flavisolibacter sp.]